MSWKIKCLWDDDLHVTEVAIISPDVKVHNDNHTPIDSYEHGLETLGNHYQTDRKHPWWKTVQIITPKGCELIDLRKERPQDFI